MNIIPPLKTTSPDYFCTWETQYGLARRIFGKAASAEAEALAFAGDQGASRARDALNEEALFGRYALTSLYSEARSAMFLVLDDGWDVGYGISPRTDKHAFGSLRLSEERFPSCTGTPAERLRALSDRIKAQGWRGLGIWVCAQKAGHGGAPFEPTEETLSDWKEKLLMSKEAGVCYWKVDWGRFAHSEDFRKTLTELGRALYPELIIEHTFCTAPLNGDPANGKTRFADDVKCADGARRFAAFSRVFRSYDVTPALSVSTTLDRLSHLLACDAGVVNCEDELYIGAVLGCSLGVMRSPLTGNQRLDEVTAAIRWHSVAPAFSGGQVRFSEKLKTDSFFFSPEDTWFSPAWNKLVSQSAPQIIARNAALPEVEGEDPPYILLSKNPSGVYSVGAIPPSSESEKQTPPRVSFEADTPPFIGVFGSFDTLTVSLAKPPKRVYVQSLIRGEAREIFPVGSRLTLSGNLLRELHTSSDGSQSAAVVKILY